MANERKRVTRVSKEIVVKRDMQPSFPHGIRTAYSASIMILDFLTEKESDEYQHSFSSIVINQDVAKDLIIRLLAYVNHNNFIMDGLDITMEDAKKE